MQHIVTLAHHVCMTMTAPFSVSGEQTQLLRYLCAIKSEGCCLNQHGGLQ